MEEKEKKSEKTFVRFMLSLSDEDQATYNRLLETKPEKKDIGSFYNRLFTVGIQCLGMECTDEEIIDSIKKLQSHEPVSKKVADCLSQYLISYMKGRGYA